MTKEFGTLLVGLAALMTAALVLPSTGAEPKTNAAAQNFAIEHEIGHRFHIDPADLPAPKTGPIASNRSLTIPFGEQTLSVPEGFTATLFASGLVNPRRLLVLPNGDVLVTDQDGIWRVPHVVGALRAGRPQPAQKAADVPPDQRKPVPGAYGAQLLTAKGVFGIAQGHQNRGLAIDPKTGALFVGVGSSGNLGVEPEPKATIQRFDADGGNQTTFAAGMRNPTALAFQPTTGDLWAVVQERDGLGDNLPSDYLIRVQQGGFYGWPYAYIGKHPQPGFAQLAPDKVNATLTPDFLFQAHSSLLDLVFYAADQFPSDYKGSLFVALKGSWNRSVPTGYKIVRVPFKDGRPEGYYENFATGFWASGNDRAEVWGRPAALAVAKDGALLVGDDTGGTIWRIAYSGGR